MKVIVASVVLTVLAGGAQAQQRPSKPPSPPPQQQQQQAAPPGAEILFPCRTEQEVCYVGGVKDGKLVVLFTNDPKAEEISGKPIAVTAGEGSAPINLSVNESRIMMLTGTYDPKAGLTKAQVVDVASPLAAFAIKAAVGGGGDDSGAPQPPPPPSRKR